MKVTSRRTFDPATGKPVDLAAKLAKCEKLMDDIRNATTIDQLKLLMLRMARDVYSL